ncbi:MAG: methylated-DNA--[protein]-cysteine S-methyltransferase [Coriobacteriia bacterium]|nr:methylated-DNA--[protein]-cysteine S-methyltransferase [Coriobacteriia bacterium]
MNGTSNYFAYNTPFGKVTLQAVNEKITRLVPGDVPLVGTRASSNVTNAAATQLQEYLAGHRRMFDVPIDPQGTDFQKEVWRMLELIPFGETRTYAQVAASIGRPGAARAVGGANNANPIPIIIPCHRVVAANGMGGYAYGLDMKRFLLELEQRAKD